MVLETNRLTLIPLSADQLFAWAENLPALEKELDMRYLAEPMTGRFRDIVLSQAAATRANPESWLWHTLFLILRRSDRTAVGSADFKNVPDGAGCVEIGYGLGKAFEKNGYMTEAVRAMCAWALGQAGVSSVVAETEKWNTPSQRVLARCGFALDREGETLWWRLSPSGGEARK